MNIHNHNSKNLKNYIKKRNPGNYAYTNFHNQNVLRIIPENPSENMTNDNKSQDEFRHYQPLDSDEDVKKPFQRPDICSKFCERGFKYFRKQFGMPDFVYEKNEVKLNDAESISSEKEFQLKRYRFLMNFKYKINPKERKKAAKTIQHWWRSKIHDKISKLRKIKFIQRTFRDYLETKKVKKNLKEKIRATVSKYRLDKLYYLLNLTVMHKNISKDKTAVRALHAWRILVKIINMKSKQLEIMERNFRKTYENLAVSMFGDRDMEPSIQSEMYNFFERVHVFGSNVTSPSDNVYQKNVVCKVSGRAQSMPRMKKVYEEN